MKQGSWDECIQDNIVIRKTPEIGRIKSLIKMSKSRIEFLSHSTECNFQVFIFEGLYTSLLELLHAVLLINGFQVINHNCLGFFLRDVLNKNDLYVKFNDLRIKRNLQIYYGKYPDNIEMDIKKCKNLIAKIQTFLSNLSFSNINENLHRNCCL